MKYRRLGKTNLRVSVIGMGTWQLGGEWGKNFAQSEVDQMFDAARDVGINLIDTAECYGDHTSEQFIGNAVSRDREKWIIATKFGHVFTGHLKRSDERSAADCRKQVEESLKALRTSYIDILQYHSVRDSEFENDELTNTLLDLVKAGKVRHIGNSISRNAGVLLQTEQSTRRHVEVLQLIYNRLDRAPEGKVFDSCIKQDLGVLARIPLASGFLSGKYKPGAKFPSNDVRGGNDKVNDEKLAEVEKIKKNEVPPGIDMAKWALAWCLKHSAVTAVIPGCKDVGQVRSNAAAAELVEERP